MNARLQSDLDGLESALGGLTESITAYNPSMAAAQGVLAADAGLGKGIEELIVHQRNHATLTALQREATQLESQLRAALGDLAAARAQIQAAGSRARPPPASYRSVDAQALLDHAHHAAPYAAPVGFVPPPKEGAAIGEATIGAAGGDEAVADPAPSQSQADTATNTHADNAAAAAGAERNNPALAALEPGLRAWLDPITQLPFTPWPSNDMVARSGMARVQGWSGAVDLSALLAEADEQAAAAARPPVADEGAAAERQQQEEADEEERRRAKEARARAHQQQQQQKSEKQVFRGMELLESDEE